MAVMCRCQLLIFQLFFIILSGIVLCAGHLHSSIHSDGMSGRRLILNSLSCSTLTAVYKFEIISICLTCEKILNNKFVSETITINPQER